MNHNYSCDIIKDLLPGYIDGILSEVSTETVKNHLEECSSCNQAYLEMLEELDNVMDLKEQIALDGFKKIRQRTKKLKISIGIVTGVLIFLLLSVFLKVFVIGEPLSTHQISLTDLTYNEETDCLEISGMIALSSYHVSRVAWKQSEEESNAVNVLVYGAETLPFIKSENNFNLSIPNMKGKMAYLACLDYDQQEIYNWKHDHYGKLAELEDEIYDSCVELDRTKDALSYTGGIESVDGREGVRYYVDSIIGENVTYWRFNEQLVTDGDFVPRDFEIWISLEKPYQILIYDYKTGEYSKDYSIINRK